jgi:hypothetical protein
MPAVMNISTAMKKGPGAARNAANEVRKIAAANANKLRIHKYHKP